MSKDDVSARLRALATDDKRRPETARLRDVFDDVEATLKAGISQADVLAELNNSGYSMTMASFKSALQRIRKERKSQGDKRSPTTPNPAQAARPTAFEPTPENNSQNVDDLAGLDKKQRREQRADQFIKPENTNPLLKRIKDQNK